MSQYVHTNGKRLRPPSSGLLEASGGRFMALEEQPRPTALAERIEKVNAHIGSQLRSRRLGMGISEESVARVLCISLGRMRAFEAGTKELTLNQVVILARVLNVPPDYFYCGLQDF